MSDSLASIDISIQGTGGSIVLGAEPNTAIMVLGGKDGTCGFLAMRGVEPPTSTTVYLTDEGRKMLIAALEKLGD